MAGLKSGFSHWLQSLTEEYGALSDQEKNITLSTLISISGSSQLLMLSSCLPDYVYRDFILNLPLEITLHILQYLNGQELCVCCQVSKSWNERISSLTHLWLSVAREIGVNITNAESSHSSKSKSSKYLSYAGDIYKSHSGSFKDLYQHAVKLLKGFQCGSSINICTNFIEKDSWRITSVGFFLGNVVTGCDDHTVQVWSVPDGTVLHSVATNSVCCLTIADRQLFTASFNANAESWDLVSGRHLRTFTGHTSAVLAIDVMPDQSFLLTGSVDKSAKLWDLKTLAHPLVKTFDSAHEDWVFHVKFLTKEENQLVLVTCDANMICVWKTDLRGNVISFSHISVEGSAKFTSFYHHPDNLCHMFACHWTEWTKSSCFFEYRIQTRSLNICQTLCFHIPMEGTKAYLLGAGLKFAVIMCSISRKDFHVLDLQKKTVVATIATPYFCILTRNGSTVTLCDTKWLDGFNFSQMHSDTPVFAAWIAVDRVMLGTWAKVVSQIAG